MMYDLLTKQDEGEQMNLESNNQILADMTSFCYCAVIPGYMDWMGHV